MQREKKLTGSASNRGHPTRPWRKGSFSVFKKRVRIFTTCIDRLVFNANERTNEPADELTDGRIEANSCNKRQARENACKQDTINWLSLYFLVVEKVV